MQHIGTLNCGHSAHPIILGVTPPQYSKAELARMQQASEEDITAASIIPATKLTSGKDAWKPSCASRSSAFFWVKPQGKNDPDRDNMNEERAGGVISMPKGVPNKRYTAEFKKMVVETMPNDKLSYKETARRFGVSCDTRVKD